MKSENTDTAAASTVRSRRRRRLFRLVVVACALVFSTLLAEVLLRFYIAARGWTANCYAADLVLYVPHSGRGAELRPGFRMRSGVFTTSVNSLGLRGPEIAQPKEAGTTRIAILGGSSVFGYLVNDGEEAAQILQSTLNDGGQQVEVLNAGVPGYNLFMTSGRFQELIAPLAPDMVVLYLGWNDLPYLCSNDPNTDRFRLFPIAPGYERVLGRTALYGLVFYRLWGGRQLRLAPAHLRQSRATDPGRRQFGENLRQLADSIEAMGARILICAQGTAAREDAAPELKQMLSQNPEITDEVVQLGGVLRETLKNFAQRRGLPYFDLNEHLPADTTVLRDYVHLTRKGERRLAELLAARLANMPPLGSQLRDGRAAR